MKALIGLSCIIVFVVTSCIKPSTCPSESASNTSEIEHYDWTPDLIITDSIALDLDSNGVDDLLFFTTSEIAGSTSSGGAYYNESAKVKSINPKVSFSFGNQLLENITYDNSYDCLEEGDIINNDLTWYDFSSSVSIKKKYFSGVFLHLGIWDVNPSYGYIGVKVEGLVGNCFYWIKLSASTSSITLKEMKRNPNVNQPILVGG
ncbi:MAG: hypothetical protein P8N52_03685 [Crocinitomicaceae bacterium]|nr:hypothetical protein [Crocinitomicaceae bacterium]MDG1777006.1 hypothetical protein [Crocinitomicaceae bacterium]